MHRGLEPDAAALLLAKIDTPGPSGAEEAAAMAAAFRSAGAIWAGQSSDEVEAEALFAARRLAYPALERLGPVLTEDICVPRSAVPAMFGDICVPRSAVPAMFGDIEDIARRHGVQIATVA